ncbi:MAG: hypothetical protein JGK30_00185 [Microcoleus sp. PH2017_40_RAT_O_B]|uniref:hypothetical protein n=1 Tax=unclassified Microcoleus TaxID=2642155 RepID=UPI001D922386|nr:MULTISPECIES: hypothetical protein [unclassified Microcoleus]MCC3570518.1 hypothetical protein [Microcoleus sp. PH2017_34_RAT_O_A]MCC3607959.1 hypothetical protein [Microcoleus sp. PH2017_40_RAT_O_B]
MKVRLLILGLYLPVTIGMVLFGNVEPSKAGWNRIGGKGMTQYMTSNNNQERQNGGLFLMGIGIVGGVIAAAVKKQ